jgi:hypothetical protein
MDLRSTRRGAAALALAASLAFAPAALASGGGVNSGGVNAGGVNAGGGGGGGGGGGKVATAPSSCGTISSFSNTTGYYAVWAAIWTNYSISLSSCGGGSQLTWDMTYLNGNTGQVDFERSGPVLRGVTSGLVDED